MLNLVKKTAQCFVRSCGYEIRSIAQKSKASLLQIPLDHERTREEYDLIWSDSQIRDSYISEQRRALYNTILDRAEEAGFLADQQSIGDIGCGPGHLFKYISERCRPRILVGFDFSVEVLRIARQMCPKADFREHDVYDQLEEEFDLLFCIEVLEHLLYPRKALEILFASTSKIVLSIPNGRTDTYVGHINYWSLESWHVFLEPFERSWEFQVKYVCNDKNIVTTLRRRQ